MDRAERLLSEIRQIEAVTAEFEAAAGDLLSDQSVAPSNEMAREEVISLLGVNYIGPEVFNKSFDKIFEPKSTRGWFKDAITQLTPFKDRVIPIPFEEPKLDFVRLKEILNEPDEWESDKKKFETYALVFKPPRSLLELRDRGNQVAKAGRMAPVLAELSWYESEAFATETPKSSGWELVRRETVPGSTCQNYDDQKAIIGHRPYLVPASLPALTSLLVGQYLRHDIKLYNGENHFGRTSKCAGSGSQVSIGSVDSKGTWVSDFDGASPVVGLAVSRSLN